MAEAQPPFNLVWELQLGFGVLPAKQGLFLQHQSLQMPPDILLLLAALVTAHADGLQHKEEVPHHSTNLKDLLSCISLNNRLCSCYST